MASTTSEATIDKLREMFSYEFAAFMKRKAIKHILTAP